MMRTCEYVYCRTTYPPTLNECPVCGFPVDASRLRDPEFLERSLPGLDVPALFDMHQIIPAAEGMVGRQLQAMERLRIRKALLQSAPPEAASLCGNDCLVKLAASHPDRFWISQWVDPRDPGAAEILRNWAARGIRVVKLLPCAGYAVDDQALDGFWQLMEDLRMVAMVHTGFITARHKEEERRAGRFLSSKYGDPILFDTPARKFPRLQIILCHLGDAMWCEGAAQMVTQHDNVWGDVSGFGIFALRRLLQHRVALDWKKVFWGNDSPPDAYGINLRLLLAALDEGQSHHLAPSLLHDNAEAFAARFLE